MARGLFRLQPINIYTGDFERRVGMAVALEGRSRGRGALLHPMR